MDENTIVSSTNYHLLITTNDVVYSDRKPFWSCITVEPVVFLLFLGQTLSGAILTNLYLVHTCEVTLGFNHTDCIQLGSSSSSGEVQELEAQVQPRTALLLMTKSILESCLPAVLSFFLGPWSDLHGRKPLLMWPLLGYCAAFCMFLGCSLLPKLPPSLLLLASLPIALSGGFIAVISGVYSYISDVTEPDKRALRIGMLDAALFSGLLVGTLSCSRLYAVAGSMGYIAVFGSSAICCLLGFIYVLVFLPESVNSQNRNHLCCVGAQLFQWHFVSDVVKSCCKKRPNYGRAIIFMVIAALATCVITMEGEMGVSYLFTREKFAWNIKDYTTFAAISFVPPIVGMLFGVTVLSTWLKVPDATLAMCGFFTKIVGALIAAFSPVAWFLYLASCVSFFGGVVGPLSRSILTKIVPKEDIGKVFSLTSSVEALTPLAASTLYTLVYNSTITSFPGAFFLLSASIFALDFTLFLIVVIIQRYVSTPNCGDEADSDSDNSLLSS